MKTTHTKWLAAAALVSLFQFANCQETPPKETAPAPAAQSSNDKSNFGNQATTAVKAAAVAAPTDPDQAYPEPDAARLRAFIELARRDIQLQKASIIAENLPLTEPEAAEFWPLHRQYQADLAKLVDRRLALVKKFLPQAETMTDDNARALAKEALEIDDQRTALKREYFTKFEQAIPAAKAARFFQIENQLNMVLDLRLAAALPLIN
jgi:hypothetical protein